MLIFLILPGLYRWSRQDQAHCGEVHCIEAHCGEVMYYPAAWEMRFRSDDAGACLFGRARDIAGFCVGQRFSPEGLMTISGYIIEKYNNMSDAYTCRRLAEEAKASGIDLRIIGVHDTVITDHGIYNAGQLLERRDFVINRYKWGKIKDRINELAEKSYNPLEAYNIYVNKYEQVRRLSSEEFLVPCYILGTARTEYEYLAGILGAKIVAKGLESSMGKQVVLVESQDDLEKLLTQYGPEKEWLFEEFISASCGRDIRFYSIRGEVTACMQRKSLNDFRANVALGAVVQPYRITDPIRTIARDIYDQTGLDFLGIDLLFGTQKPYFCEINVMPGLEGIERASGKNVAGNIIKTIKGDF